MTTDRDTEKLWATLAEWSRQHQIKPPVAEHDVFKLSWDSPDGNIGYIDVYPDPKQSGVVVVQHGTIDPQTDEGCLGGVTRWRCNELDRNLTELKNSIDAMVLKPEPLNWKYTPSIDIGSVKGFKFR